MESGLTDVSTRWLFSNIQFTSILHSTLVTPTTRRWMREAAKTEQFDSFLDHLFVEGIQAVRGVAAVTEDEKRLTLASLTVAVKLLTEVWSLTKSKERVLAFIDALWRVLPEPQELDLSLYPVDTELTRDPEALAPQRKGYEYRSAGYPVCPLHFERPYGLVRSGSYRDSDDIDPDEQEDIAAMEQKNFGDLVADFKKLAESHGMYVLFETNGRG